MIEKLFSKSKILNLTSNVHPIGMIGWRLRKHYFRTTLRLTGKHQLVKSGSQPQAKQQQLQSSSLAFNGSLESPNNSSSQTSSELVLTWTEYGPDRSICDKEIHNIFKYIGELHHPFIEPFAYVTSNDNGALMIRKFYAQGSLKDILCGSSPKNPFLGTSLSVVSIILLPTAVS